MDGKIEHAAFGVAGPVVEGSATITNLPWQMSEEQLSATLDIPSVQLLNDLAATAHSVPYLTADDLCTLNMGEPDPHGAVAIIAPGTGLGEAFITVDPNGRYTVHPSEGGHSDFAPTTARRSSCYATCCTIVDPCVRSTSALLMSAMSASARGAACPTSTHSSKMKDSSSRSGWQSD